MYTEVGEKGEEASHRASCTQRLERRVRKEVTGRDWCTQRLERRVRKEVIGRAVHRGWREE